MQPGYWDTEWDNPEYVKDLMDNHFPKDWTTDPLDRVLVEGMRRDGYSDIQIAWAYKYQF